MNRNYLLVILYTSMIIVVGSAIHLFCNGLNEESLRLMIRWSAKISSFLFAMAFGIASWHYFINSKLTSDILRYRAHLGLTFGVFHTYHLFCLIGLQYAFHPVFVLAKTSSLIGGSLAYIFMYLMMLTTFPSIKIKMSSKNWNILHLVGGYWIWTLFFRTYLINVLNKDQYYFHFTLLALVIISRLLHVSFRYKERIFAD